MKTSLNAFYVRFAIYGALLYCIPVLYLFLHPISDYLWLPYLGNGLFICLIIVGIIYVNHRAGGSAGLKAMIIGGMKITVLSIAISCLLILLMLICFRERLQQAPIIQIPDRTNGLTSILFFNAIIVNFPSGAFASLIGAIATKRNQQTDLGNEVE
jgi:hypothetical protein